MGIKGETSKRLFGFIVSVIAWFCILFQWYMTAEPTAYFFSYFTVLCNLLIAICTFCVTVIPASRPGLFFSRLSVQTSIALYIFIVALVYNLALRGLVELAGWNIFLNEMLHVVIPVLFIVYWVFCRSAGRLEWIHGLYWMAFPFFYLVYSLIRGSIIHWYPYPFLNAMKFGYGKVAINITIMLLVFCVAGFILIGITRSLRKKALQ